MVAIPLVAGKEKVGVLEVLNKAGGEPFQEEDRLLLQSIAEEIAFAIHDAKLFDAKQALTAEIKKMHQFQTKLIQTSHDGIIANDPRGNILIFNEGAELILCMEKQYGTSNGHSKWTHLVYCNTDRTSQPQAGASEPGAGGTPHMRAALGSPFL